MNTNTSLRRRLRFDGDLRYAFDRIGARIGERTRIHRAPERAAMVLFDLAESVRQGGRVESFGDPVRATSSTSQLPQHPRYLGYWHDKRRNSVVGMMLGVDLIETADGFCVIEMNLDAALRPERRALYPDEVDPLVSGIVQHARNAGLERIVALKQRWRAHNPNEFTNGTVKLGMPALAASPHKAGSAVPRRLVAMPVPLESDTLYVSFSSRHAPIDHFVHNKTRTTSWLPCFLPSGSDVGVWPIPTFDEPFVPDESDSGWPNLVAKMASWDSGRYVEFLRLRGTDVLSELGLKTAHDRPYVLKLTLRDRLEARLLSRGQVLYQPYVRPPTTPDGHAVTIRMNLLVTPIESTFLSAHTIISSHPVPPSLPFGPVEDRRPFLTSFSDGAHYGRLDPDAEARLRAASIVLGDAIRAGIEASFETQP